MRRNLYSITFATVLLASRLSAQSTVYTTFGPGDSYNGSTCCSSTGWFIGSTDWFAAGFLYGGPSGDLLSAIRFAAFLVTPGPLDISFLFGPTIAGATELESWSVPSPGPTAQIYSLPSVNQPVLTPGQTYWVMLASGNASAQWGWSHNDQGLVSPTDGFAYFSQDGGATWSANDNRTLPAYDVTSIAGEVGAVPEPATISMLATGLVGLVIISWRRRKQA